MWLRRSSWASIVCGLLFLGPVSWGGAALWLDIPANYSLGAARFIGPVLGALFWLLSMGALLFYPRKRRALAFVASLLIIISFWWYHLPPQNDRPWMRDVAKLPWVEVSGPKITIHNLRDFVYRSETDFDERWRQRTYDLRDITGMDIFFCYWGPRAIAHNIVSWNFADGGHLAISIETRKEVGESYSAVRGFFRQYELYYVVADERDVIRLRTNYRGEELFLYHTAFTPDQARALLQDYIKSINHLVQEPLWYNALTMNCLTTIRMHLHNIGLTGVLNWRILANGYADRLAYDLGVIDNSLPFAELRRRSAISAKARGGADNPNFSDLIRQDHF